VHVRYSGPSLFIDTHVLIDGNKTLWQVHELTDLIEKIILEITPYATVVVHPEPITL
jgi:divalent metal cation (Fe/Co/Zn/Cd) transporter